jgi:transcriptional regulator with XRE-family HTH domain
VKRSADRFAFPLELGVRLRELRRKAGLSQLELARTMGFPGRRAGTMVARLEAGRSRQPTLGLIADYLRACGAGFSSITDIMDRHTAKPSVVEQTVSRALVRMTAHLPVKVAKVAVNYDIGVEAEREAHEKPKLDPLKRLARAKAAAAAAFRREVVRSMLTDAVEHAGVRLTHVTRIHLTDYGHKVFRILYSTRRSRPERREKLLAEAEAWMAGFNVLPLEALQFIQGAMRKVYDRMVETGDINWQPEMTLEDLDKVLLTPTGSMEMRRERQERRNEYDRARWQMQETIWREAGPLLGTAGVAEGRRPAYRFIVPHVCHTAARHGAESDETRRSIEERVADPELVRRGIDPDVARRLAEFALKRFGELRSTLPPEPGGPAK